MNFRGVKVIMEMKRRVCKRLSKRQRQIFELMLESIKQKDIAKMIKMPLPTVKKYIKKIKKIVLEEYDKHVKGVTND